MKNSTATYCSLLRCVFAALTLIVSQSVSHAQAGALTFSENAQQYVAVPDFDTLGFTTEVTVEFWARFTTTAPDQTAFGIEPDVIGNRFLAHLFGLGENIYWDFGDIQNGGRVSFPNSGGPTAGWTHYAFVASQSGNVMKIYIDGAEASSVASFNDLENTVASTLRIGSGSGDYFDGSIDDFRVWNVVRTPAQIAAARTGILAGNESGLRLYFKFDEASGNTAINSATATGAAYNGTLVNAPTRTCIHTVISTANSGPGTLRQVVLDAAAGDTIFFDPTVFATPQTITLTSGEIVLDKSLVIDGAARSSQVTISGGNASRIFYVSTGQTVALKGLTLTGGNGTGASATDNGGAILNQGTLTLTQCTLSGNSATYAGGAVENDFGVLTLTQCTLSGNSATNSPFGSGGAIDNRAGQLTLSQCTLSGNSAPNVGGAIENIGTLTLTLCTLSGNSAGRGGAIYNDYSTLTLTHCTLAGNSAYEGGAVMNWDGTLTLTNSVVAGSVASPNDIYNSPNATLTSVGANIVQSFANTGTWNGTGTIGNAAPQLAPLANFGGPTQTMPPLPDSPAIDGVLAGSEVAGLITDQRGTGFARVRDGNGDGSALVDIGAVEFQRIVVTTAADELDTPTGAQTSLREAVRDHADAIGFAPGLNGGTITLAAARGEIFLGRSVTIDASNLGSGVTISGGGATRIFTVDSGLTVTLHGLTLTGGNGAGAAASGNGGAIFKHSGSALTLTRCTLSGNSGSNGGAIFEVLGGTLALTDCTLSGNTAGNNGGAILHSTGTLALTHCTLSGNSASVHGGAIYNGSTLTLTNSIVSGSNASPDDIYNPLYSTVTRVGASIVQSLFNDGGTENGSGTISTAAPQLAPLGNYGGPTKTMPPLPGSPAIDAVPAGSEVAGLQTDQRGFGFPRVQDGDGNGSLRADIGAVEVRRIVVTTTADELDTPTGVQTSLREAIRDNTTADAIGFAPGLNGGTITLDAAKGEIVLARSMTIDASGLSGGVTVDGGPGTNRILTVSSGQSVALKGLTLTGGNGTGAVGSGYGGAILNYGTLMLTRCALWGNSGYAGGAIENDNVINATLALTQCTLSGNSANYGGAISSSGTLALTQCTLSGNSAVIASMQGGYGGAIHNNGPLTSTHCTLSGNSATYGGAIYKNAGTLTLTNSIVAGNTAPSGVDIHGTIASGTNNLVGVNPLLAPLGNYGGPTQTMALLPGSPARNAAAVLVPAITADQRGFPIVGTPDIGAYEAGTFTNYNAWIWENLPTVGDGTLNDPLHAATFDYDGDGVTNGNEWIALTEPANPASYLRITQTTHTGDTNSGAISVTFPSVVGRNYTLEYSADLIAWAPFSSAPGTGELLTLTVTYNGYAQLFVRVRVGP